jgi:hypothetical protein
MRVFAVLGRVAVDENDIPEQVDQGRPRFLSTAGTAALAVGAAGLAVAGPLMHKPPPRIRLQGRGRAGDERSLLVP